MPVASGTRLGVYEFIAPIGAGDMGDVYRARDTRLDREVALKILPDAFANDPEGLARFKRESAGAGPTQITRISQAFCSLEEGAGISDWHSSSKSTRGATPMRPVADKGGSVAAGIP